MARARGSYPRCHWFKSSCRYQQRTDFFRFHIDKRPGGQAVKTPPFHGGNTGSSPVRVTTFSQPFIWRHSSAGRASASHAEGHRFEFCCLHQNKKQLRKQLLFVLGFAPCGRSTLRRYQCSGSANPPLRNSSLRSEFTAHTRRRPEGRYESRSAGNRLQRVRSQIRVRMSPLCEEPHQKVWLFCCYFPLKRFFVSGRQH